MDKIKVEVYSYKHDSEFGIKWAVRSLKSMFPTENEMSWKLFNASNNWRLKEDAEKWCIENGYTIA